MVQLWSDFPGYGRAVQENFLVGELGPKLKVLMVSIKGTSHYLLRGKTRTQHLLGERGEKSSVHKFYCP